MHALIRLRLRTMLILIRLAFCGRLLLISLAGARLQILFLALRISGAASVAAEDITGRTLGAGRLYSALLKRAPLDYQMHLARLALAALQADIDERRQNPE